MLHLSCWTRLCVAAASLLLAPLSVPRGLAQGIEDRPFVPTPEVVRGTINALSDPFEAVVLGALQDLSEWRSADAAAAIQKLLPAETAKTVRADAFQYFLTLGEKVRSHLPTLVPYLQDPQPGVRERVVHAITVSGAAAEFQAAVLPLLSDSRKEVRVAAAECLGSAGKAAAGHRAALLAALGRAGSPEFKVALLDALTQLGNLPLADLGKVLPFLQDRDSQVRVAACATVFNALADARKAGDTADFSATRETLLTRFRQEPPEVRGAILKHAVTDADSAKSTLDLLHKELADFQPEPRKAALFALGLAGESSLPRVDAIVAQFQSDDAEMRAAVLTALRGVGPKAVEPHMALVMKALLDPADPVRREALLTLPLCGKTLKSRPYKVLDVFTTVPVEVRENLLKACAVIIRVLDGDDEALVRLRQSLVDPQAEQRIAACFVAGQLGNSHGTPIFPELLALLGDADPAVQGAAAVALRSFTGQPEARQKIRAALRPLLGHNDDQVRWAALDALAETEPGQDAGLVDDIAARLLDSDRSVRNAALRTLGFGGPAAAGHLPAIIGMFSDDPDVPPFAAARTLLQLAPLRPRDVASLLQQAYLAHDVLPLVRLTGHAVSAGKRDCEILLGVLDRTGRPLGEVITKAEIPIARTVLAEALTIPSLHPKLREEITRRTAELERFPGN